MRSLIIALALVLAIVIPACTPALPEPTMPPDEAFRRALASGATGVSVSPGIIRADNYRKGTPTPQEGLTVWNLDSVEKTWIVSFFRTDTNLTAGFSPAPKGAEDWVSIGRRVVTVKPTGSMTVPISLFVPENASVPTKWEFWLDVREKDNPAMVQTAAKVRYQVIHSSWAAAIVAFSIGGTLALVVGLLYLLDWRTRKAKERQ